MKEAAVIGTPISHSRSPAIFRFLANHLGRTDIQYTAQEILPGELSAFLSSLRARPDFVGVNVTIPHKQAVMRGLDDISLEARAVGAVNVVHAQAGHLQGYNTDVLGIVQTLAEQKCAMQGQDAWIWGAGGAARAVVYALCRIGARCIYLKNRDLDRAAKIQDELGSLFPSTSIVVAKPGTHSEIQPLSLLVNSTPLGMKGAAPVGDFFAEMGELPLKRDALAFDLIYKPERTPFLTMAEALDLKTLSGLDMLIYQALATWEIWFGPLGPDARAVLEVKNALARHLREAPIFLTGFMGVGKSSIGSALAAKLGWEHLDTDDLIVRKADMPISKIFETHGEAGFRELERQAVADACAHSRVVVSLGGGALMNPECLTQVERAGPLICLDASPEFLKMRLSGSSTRPLLAGLDEGALDEKIRSMLEIREPVYSRAMFRVPVENFGSAEVADGILDLLFNRESRGQKT